jgi:hypothetical protein
MTCTFSGAGACGRVAICSCRATSCKSDIGYWSQSKERADSQGGAPLILGKEGGFKGEVRKLVRGARWRISNGQSEYSRGIQNTLAVVPGPSDGGPRGSH